jgi:hypothetical protein
VPARESVCAFLPSNDATNPEGLAAVLPDDRTAYETVQLASGW